MMPISDAYVLFSGTQTISHETSFVIELSFVIKNMGEFLEATSW